MPRKLIGITCETTLKSGLESPRQALPRPYVWAIEKAGVFQCFSQPPTPLRTPIVT